MHALPPASSTTICDLTSSGSPSARPQPNIITVRAPRNCHPPVSPWSEYPSPSEARTPPRAVDPVAPPQLLAPSPPPSPVDPSAPPGSLVPPAPPWSGVDPPSPLEASPLATPRRSIPPAPLGSFLPPAPPWSSVAPAPPWISASALVARDLAPQIPHPGPPDPRHPPGSLALRLHLGLLLHLLCRRWSAPWSRRPSILHGSSHRRLHCGPLLWRWPGSCCAPSAPGPSCLLPGSSLLRCPPGLCLPAPTWVSVLLQSHLPCSQPVPPSVVATARGRTFWEGSNVRVLDCLCVCFCSL